MNELPEIIRSQHDTVRFCFWLEDHPEVTMIQGMEVRRGYTGKVIGFGRMNADVYQMFPERKSFNDWIRTYRNKHA